tara:strand:- start:187 stop:669 length:483 start_codon:yes stop_codon:yes gene_type:complete
MKNFILSILSVSFLISCSSGGDDIPEPISIEGTWKVESMISIEGTGCYDENNNITISNHDTSSYYMGNDEMFIYYIFSEDSISGKIFENDVLLIDESNTVYYSTSEFVELEEDSEFKIILEDVSEMNSSIKIITHDNISDDDCFEVHENIINLIKSNLPQ